MSGSSIFEYNSLRIILMENSSLKKSESTTLSLEKEKQALWKNFEQTASLLAPRSALHIEIGGIFLRKISFSLTRFLQAIGYNEKKLAAYQEQPIILNIGAGDFVQGKFITTDIIPSGGELIKLLLGEKKLKNELFLDITHHDKHLSNRVDGIVLSHVLEHIPATLAVTALRCCFDYLKPGCGIRISVPYLGVYDRVNWPGSQEIKSAMLAKNRLIYGWGHKFMYDAELLSLLLEKAGFSEVKEVTFGEGLLSETDNPSRRFQSIYLTGIKA
jgi:predicted SAM-dependent methyltransferase